MTVQNVGDFETGLEEFGMEDMVIPRLSIVHKEGEFKDSLTNEQFSKINIIILGLVKQRVLWHTKVDDDDWPMCRSADHNTGIPNLSDDQPKEKRFPWDKSGFDPAHYPADDEGRIRLPCSGCQLKEWGSHPDGKKPYCSEQFTLPVLYDPREDDNWVPAIMTFQKTGLKPLKSYLSSFARSKTAAFSAVTEVTLTLQKKGSTDYSTPNFKRVGDTDDVDWREYSTNFRTMKEFLTADPGSRDEDEGGTPASATPSTAKEDPWAPTEEPVKAEVVPEEKAAPVPTPEPEAKAPAAEPAAAAPDDDDLPF